MILYGFDEEVLIEIDETEDPYEPSWYEDDGRYDDDPSPYDGTYSEE